MNEPELEPLPQDVQELLRRTAPPRPPPGFGDAVVARVGATLGVAGLAAVGASTARTALVASRSIRAWTHLGVKLGTWGIPVSLASLAVGGAIGATVGMSLSRTAPPPVLQQVAPVVRSPPQVEPPAMPPPRPKAANESKPAHKGAPPPAPAPLEHRDVALAEERRLIEMARTQLAQGRSAEALQTVADHARQYPEGQLAEERESVWIQALVGVGHVDAARVKATQFRERYPHSLLLPAIEATLPSGKAP